MVTDNASEDGARRDSEDRPDQDRRLIHLISQQESDQHDEGEDTRPDQGGANLRTQRREFTWLGRRK